MAPVLFSRNVAAQLHAEDILGAKQLSHWTTDGMKPYMKYSMHNGTGYVKQNAACKQIIIPYGIGLYNSSRIDPARSIEELEYAMMYDDSSSQWGHRENILDKHHTHVSIGIAYNDHYFAYVQNFENNYLQLNRPMLQIDWYNRKHIEISGRVINDSCIHSISIFYDVLPNSEIYEQHKNEQSYEFGKLIAIVVRPIPSNYYYIKPDSYSLIEADSWWPSELSQSHSSTLKHEMLHLLNVRFNISHLIKNPGVYTIVLNIQDIYNDTYPITSKSIFVR